MLFVSKGYCRYAGKKCWHLKVKDGVGYCKKRMNWYGNYSSIIRNEKTGNPKNISKDKNVDVRAPKWCHKL